MSSEFKEGDTVRVTGYSPWTEFPDPALLPVGTVWKVGAWGRINGWETDQEHACHRLELVEEITSDPVVRPNHYARYTLEPATFIAANKLPFDVGNVVKYVLRFDAKNGIEDLEKARRYIDMTIERLRREARVVGGEDASEVWRAML